MVPDSPFADLVLGTRQPLPLFQVSPQVVQTIQVSAFSLLLLNSLPNAPYGLGTPWSAATCRRFVKSCLQVLSTANAEETTLNEQFLLEARTPHLISFLP